MNILREPFLQAALLAGAISAVACAYLGVFVILKRVVFMGIALSEIAALGVAVGLFIGINPMASAIIFTLIGIVLFWLPFTEKRLSRESIIGFAYAFSACLSVILIAKNPLVESRGLNLISGNLLYATRMDLYMLGAASLIIFALHAFFFKEFVFISFDRETAFTTGIKTDILDFILYITIGLMISVSMKTCGVIFVFASLVIPPMMGLVISRRIGMIFIISCVSALICVAGGLLISYIFDLPSSPTIVGLYSVLFIMLFGITLIRKS